MRVFIERERNVIAVPTEFAALEKYSDDGLFHYRFRYQAELSEIFQKKSFKVKISVLENRAIQQKFQIFVQGFNPAEIVDRLRLQSALQKDLRRQKADLVILSKLSDITKKIPNDANQRQSALSGLQRRFSAFTRISTKTDSVADLNRQNLTMPILDSNRNANDILKNPKRKNRVLPKNEHRKQSLRMIYRKNLDPADVVGTKSNSYVSGQRSMAGLIPRRRKGERKLQEMEVKMRSILERYFSDDLPDNHRELSIDQVVTTVVKESPTYVEVEETFQIPIGDIGNDDFLVEFSVLNNRGLPIQTEIGYVKHSENVTNILVPVEPPSITVNSSKASGRNLIRIRQNDEHATGVSVYKRTIPTNEVDTDSEYFNVASIPLQKINGETILFDDGVSGNPTIYRAIATSATGELGGGFSSFMVGQKNIKAAASGDPVFKRQNYATITHEIVEKRVRIEVSNTAPEVSALRLRRKDLTINERTFTDIGNVTLLNRESSSPLVYEDNSVKAGRIYLYKTTLIFEDGAEIDGSSQTIVDFTPLTSNIVEIETSVPQIETSEDDIDVTFTIRKDIISTQMDLIKNLLSEQGLSTEFQDSITQERQKLQDLFFIRVTRTNLVTGEIEDFGVINDLNFSDQKFGAVKNVEPLESGVSYKYALITYARSAETLFTDLTRDVTGSLGSYTLTPSKYLHPLALTKGNLNSQSSIKRNHSQSEFTLGTIVDITYIDVDLRSVLPNVSEVKASFVAGGVLLKWKVDGDATKIDHFIVSMETLGIKTIIGKAHNITETNEFQFIDVLDNGEAGGLEYIITPMYYDYSPGTESRSNRIII